MTECCVAGITSTCTLEIDLVVAIVNEIANGNTEIEVAKIGKLAPRAVLR